MLRRLATKQPTAFTNRNEVTYWFDEDGVYKILTTSINVDLIFPSSFPPPKESRRIWYLANAPYGTEPLFGEPYRRHPGLFYAVFISPNATRYRKLLTSGAQVWIMEPWPADEIAGLCVSPPAAILVRVGS